MDSVKGVFRRAKQQALEVAGKTEGSHDSAVQDAVRELHHMEKVAGSIAEKTVRLGRTLEEAAFLMRSIGDEYKSLGESRKGIPMANELSAFGNSLSTKTQEVVGKNMKESYEALTKFKKEVPSLDDIEDDLKKKQREYDFFRAKTAELVKNPPKDGTRIPRNEAIRENWRREMWGANEAMKAAVSRMHHDGCVALDTALYTISVAYGNFCAYAVNAAKQHFAGAAIPHYPADPLLPASELPPPPPPYVPPVQQPGYTATAYAAPAASQHAPQVGVQTSVPAAASYQQPIYPAQGQPYPAPVAPYQSQFPHQTVPPSVQPAQLNFGYGAPSHPPAAMGAQPAPLQPQHTVSAPAQPVASNASAPQPSTSIVCDSVSPPLP